MKRMKISTFSFPFLIFVACQNRTIPNSEKLDTRPNIVLILADDLGYGDLSCYGQSNFQTPNIDKLANEGMLFTQHYSGSTVCAPSRASLLTGLHTGHTYIRGNRRMSGEGNFPLNTESVTIAEILKDAGYVTGAFGKWGLGAHSTSGAPNKQGFDEFYGYVCQTLAHNYYPYHLWHNETKVLLDGNQGANKGIYAPHLIHQEALSFIESNKDTTFFLYYPTPIPHAELDIPQEYMEKFRGKYLPEVSYKGTEEGDERFKIGCYVSQYEAHAAFVAMNYLLDVQVGEIKAKLEELGIAGNTLIIFTSDNGPHQEGGADPDYFDSNGPLRGYKRDLYEGGIRVPLIVSWPGKVKAKTQSTHVSAFWDFLPTFCELAGVEVPQNTDGISILPELIAREQPKHDYLYWEFHERGGKQAVRMDNWKGIRLNMQNNPQAEIELYNLETDIEERYNLAADHADVVVKINEIMKAEHIRSAVFSFRYEVENENE